RELREEERVHASARLVCLPQVVAERLDDVIRRDAEVRRAALEEADHRRDDRSCPTYLDALVVHVSRPGRKVLAEELVRAVDEVHAHGREPRTLTRLRAGPV